jgi:CRISPR-associated protein Cas2
MLVIVSYDVSTETADGRRRLRHIARICKNFGQRVQKSVFECKVGSPELVVLRESLLNKINQKEDSLRLYVLDHDMEDKIEHYGIKKPVDLEEPLIL